MWNFARKIVGLYMMLVQLITEVLIKFLFQNFLFRLYEMINQWANTQEKQRKSRSSLKVACKC